MSIVDHGVVTYVNSRPRRSSPVENNIISVDVGREILCEPLQLVEMLKTLMMSKALFPVLPLSFAHEMLLRCRPSLQPLS